MAGTKLPPGWRLIDGVASHLDDERKPHPCGLPPRKPLIEIVRELTPVAPWIELERQWQETIAPQHHGSGAMRYER
jgi:hypothetical protein